MMDANVYGKKQYWILMGIAVVTSLILPLLCNTYVIRSLYPAGEPNAPHSLNWIANALVTIGQFSEFVGYAASVFLIMRYRFRLCLPLIAFSVIGTIEDLILTYLEPYSGPKSYLLVLVFMLLSCVELFAKIGIIKAITRRIKKEAIQLFFIFLGLFVAGALLYVIRIELNYRVMVGFNVGAYELQEMILSVLLCSLCIAFFYLVLRIVFAHDRRQTVRRFFACIKGEIQKSIE